MTSLRRSLFLFFGFLFLGLGIIGIFLPLLPTTPFLLASAFCMSRGSQKFHDWLINHKTLGPSILNWQRNRAIPFKAKVLATTLMFFTSIFVLGRDFLPDFGKITYSTVLLAVLIFIWTRKSV